jgi:4-amino-4-deoxy-L-arabinose transferase-like glycosyltransferase
MSSALRERLRRRVDALIALGLCLFAVTWMLAVEGRQGISRDEAQYFRAGERYWTWFETLGGNLARGRLGASFSPSGINGVWSDNKEHPVIMKVLYGVSWRLFHRCECVAERAQHMVPVPGRHITLPLFARESTAFRFPAIVMAGLGVALVFAFARRFVTRAPAVVAALLSLAQPHYFFHAQIAAFDAPITVMAVAVGYCYWRSLRTGSRRQAWLWAIAAGLSFGVALGVKHNAWLMPIFLVGHYVWMRRRDVLAHPRRLPPIPAAFVSMLLLGPVVFFLHWPLLWVAPVAHTRWYVNRHLQHEHYNFEYLGRNWNNPPKEWDRRLVRATFPFVSAGFTVPVTTLALAGIGAVLLVRRRRHPDQIALLPEEPPAGTTGATPLAPAADVDRAPGAFFFVQILGPMAVIAVPDTPIFGGVKHFMPAMPYLSIVAGIGFAWLARTLATAVKVPPRLQPALPAALAALVVLPAALETRRSHPDGLSHYNLLAGGFAGGASLGMNRQFWGYSVLPMLDWFAHAVPPSRATYWHDVFPEAVPYYVRDGRIPPGLGDVGVGEDRPRLSDIGLLVYERHFAVYEGLLWEAYGTAQPIYVRTREGVPLVAVYRRPNVSPPPP